MSHSQKILLSLNQTKQYFGVLILVLIIALKAAAQGGGVLNHAYSFSKQTYTVYELTTVMQQQADISISYDAHQIKSKTKIRLPKQSMTTKELAVLLSKSYHIQTKFIGKHIILQRDMKALARNAAKKKSSAKPKQRILAANEPVKPPAGSTTTAIATQTTPLLLLPTASLDTVSDFSDTFTIDSKVVDLYDWKIAAHRETEAISKDVDRLDEPAVVSVDPIWYERFDLSFNVAGDEVFYLNPGVALHWSNFAVHGSYAIRGDLSHFRFGLSYTKPINPNLNISLWANYGLIKDQPKVLSYQYDSIAGLPDSPQVFQISGSVAYKLSGTVMKAGINLNWQLGSKLELFSGLSFNRSRTQIWYKEERLAPDNFLPTQASVSGESFSLFPKILNLSDNFSRDQSIYTRSWVGFQVGIRLYLFRTGE